jgi:CNT family concentrative nucleoside transporter
MIQMMHAALGGLLLLAIAFAFSTNRRGINLRVVLSALALQIGIGIFVFFLPLGQSVLAGMASGVGWLLGYGNAGIEFMFGPLIGDAVGFSFALNVLPVVIFFAALMAVLYHIGVMQWVVLGVGWFLNKVLGTGRVESLNASANIFVGQTEAPLVVKPYLEGITKPQLFAIMTSGLASVAGTVLAGYAQMGIPLSYLLAASFMAAPGGLLMAKILMPDDKASDKAQDILKPKVGPDRHANVLMAAAVGAKDGLNLALNIGAMLIAFVSLIALLNGFLGLIGQQIANTGLMASMGLDIPIEELSVQMILGWVFAPLMWALSVPWSEAQLAGSIVGEKIIINEFVAYLSYIQIAEEFSPRTQAILIVALCGFANLSSIGILLGGLGSLIPDRLGDIATFGLRAVLAGTLSNLMSAVIAGMLFLPAS